MKNSSGSQCGVRSGSSKQINICENAAIQFEKATEIMCSSAVLCKNEGRGKLQSNVYETYKSDQTFYLLDVMNSASDKIYSNPSSFLYYKDYLKLFNHHRFSFFSNQFDSEHWG